MTETDTIKALKMPNKIPIDHWYAEYCCMINSQPVYTAVELRRVITKFLYTKGWRFTEIFEVIDNSITWKYD